MIPTLVIDYPEALAIATHLEQSRGVPSAGTWPAFGRRPETLRANLRPVPAEPFLVINGSGNFHHETYAIVEGLCRRTPCSYLHVDAHPDKDTYFRWKLDCASFVGAIMEIPQLPEAVVLGLHLTPDLEDLPGLVLGNELNYYRCDFFAKLRQYYARPLRTGEAHFRYQRSDGVTARRNPSVHAARVQRLPVNRRQADRGLVVHWRDLSDFDPDTLGHEPVYLSVDLDVLRDAVATDWLREGPGGVGPENQGDLELDELVALLRRIGGTRQVVGADLCGLTEHFAALEPARLQQSLESIGVVYDTLVEILERG